MRYRIVGMSLLVAAAPALGMAQHQVAVAAGPVVATTAQGDAKSRDVKLRTDARQAAANVRVTLALRNVLLTDAIRAIADQAKLMPAYPSDLLPAKVVSLQVKDVTVADAFARVLNGTGLTAEISATGVVGIVKTGQTSRAGVITGRIISAKLKTPVAGATVFLEGTQTSVTTGVDGTFRIPVAAGEHTVQVRALGFVRKSSKVNVAGEGSVVIEIVLEPSASVLDEVVVTGSVVATERKAISTPITVITANDIEKRGITQMVELFRGDVPGVIALEEGSRSYRSELGAIASAQVFARGASDASGRANPLKTYVDGVEVLDGSYLGTIDPKSIDRIEIITGPQAATLYGSGAMGGVMQIFTKKGSGRQTPEITVGVRYGMLESNWSNGRTPSHAHDVMLAGGYGPGFSYAINVSYNYSGQWQPALFNRQIGGSAGITHTSGPLVASGSVSTTTGKNGTAGNYGLLMTGKLIEDGEWGSISFFSGMITGKVSTSSAQNMAFNLEYRPLFTWHHRATLGRSVNNFLMIPIRPTFRTDKDTLFEANNSNGERTSFSYSTTLQANSLRVVKADITLGVTGSWAKNIVVMGCQLTASSNSMIPCAPGSSINASSPLQDRSMGGFGQWRVGLFEQLYLTLGLRAERNPGYGRERRIDWTPTNGVSYSIEYGPVSLKLLGSYGRATRAPSPDMRKELVTVNPNFQPSSYLIRFPNELLRPERSRGPQGGLEFYYGNIGSFTVNRYVQMVDDLIQVVQGVDSTRAFFPLIADSIWLQQIQYQNVAKVRSHGWDATASIALGRFTTRGTISWTDTRVVETKKSDYAAGQSFWGFPSHSGSWQIEYASGGTSAAVAVNIIGKTIHEISDGSYGRITNEAVNARLKMYTVRRAQSAGWNAWVMPGYTKGNLNVSQRITSVVSATLRVVNLGNSYASDAGRAYPSLGRQTLLGLSMRFSKR